MAISNHPFLAGVAAAVSTAVVGPTEETVTGVTATVIGAAAGAGDGTSRETDGVTTPVGIHSGMSGLVIVALIMIDN